MIEFIRNVLGQASGTSASALFNLEGTNPRGFGGIAQLVEHLLCKQGVSGSIPLISTNAVRTESSVQATACAFDSGLRPEIAP